MELLEGPAREVGLGESFRIDFQNKMDMAHQPCHYLKPPLELFSARHTPAAMIQRAGSRSRAAATDATPHPGSEGRD